MEITVTTNTNDTVKCSSFFDAEIGFGGIDISIDEEYLGEMIGEDIPDETDLEAVKVFTDKVETWLIDNGY